MLVVLKMFLNVTLSGDDVNAWELRRQFHLNGLRGVRRNSRVAPKGLKIISVNPEVWNAHWVTMMYSLDRTRFSTHRHVSGWRAVSSIPLNVASLYIHVETFSFPEACSRRLRRGFCLMLQIEGEAPSWRAPPPSIHPSGRQESCSHCCQATHSIPVRRTSSESPGRSRCRPTNHHVLH